MGYVNQREGCKSRKSWHTSCANSHDRAIESQNHSSIGSRMYRYSVASWSSFERKRVLCLPTWLQTEETHLTMPKVRYLIQWDDRAFRQQFSPRWEEADGDTGYVHEHNSGVLHPVVLIKPHRLTQMKQTTHDKMQWHWSSCLKKHFVDLADVITMNLKWRIMKCIIVGESGECRT